jgi:hypothetical protein
MSPLTIRPAKRENVWLLLGLAGGTGSGKTYSAMRLAKGLSGDKRFAVVDTENGRASHYADDFAFDVVDLDAPFRPERYQEAIDTCVNAGHKVVVVDSMSHEWDGDGGMLDWQEEEFQRMGSRDAVKMTSWIAPKAAHRKFVTRLLQVPAHVIVCFRAAEKVDMVRDEKGKMQVVPKRSLVGLDGWVPIAEKRLPFELTLSALLTPDAPGLPKPIKLQDQHRPFLPLDSPITERTGADLGRWAAGEPTEPDDAPKLVTDLLSLAEQLGKRDETSAKISATRRLHATDPEKYVAWLRAQIGRAEQALAKARAEPTSQPQEA